MTIPAPDPGPRPELTWLPVDRLAIDDVYQRSLDTPRGKQQVTKIADGFRWAKFQAILASPRPDMSDSWLIIDGQHRVAAARQIGIPLVPAVVIQGISQAEQAAAFVGANRDRVAVSAQALFHARVAAGDPEALTVKRLCDEVGISVIRSNQAASQVAAGKTAAAPALLKMLKAHGPELTGAAISAVAECFGRDHGALRAPFFLTAARFLSERGTPAELRRALTAVGWQRLEKIGVGLGGYTMIPAMAAELRKAANRLPALQTDPATPAAALPRKPARDVATGEPWAFTEHRSCAETMAPPTAAPPPALRPLVPPKAQPAPARSEPKPSPAARQAADQDAIARFLATRGARVVMSPEQVAQLLRDAGHQANVTETTTGGTNNQPRRQFWAPSLDGQTVTLEGFYAAANALRTKTGLPAVAAPETAEATP